MSHLQTQFFRKIVSGYSRENFERYIPSIIVECIVMFCSLYNVIPCKAFINSFHVYFKDILPDINNIINIYINGKSIFYVGNDSKLYISGDNEGCQLGMGYPVQMEEAGLHSNDLIKDNISIVSHGTKNTHCFVYTNDNKLYGLGFTKYSKQGALGILVNNDWKTPTLIKYEFQGSLIQIECGTDHSLFLDSMGIMYGCGSNDKKQLSNKYKILTNITIFKYDFNNIIKIACGQYASYLVNDKMELYTVGSNQCGQLGINDDSASSNGEFNLILDHNVVTVAAGSSHVIFLTQNGQVFGFGYNAYSQCGYQIPELLKPMKINVDSDKNLIDVKCGAYHTIIVTQQNDWYSFGRNNESQLLLNINETRQMKPTKIDIQYISKYIGNNTIIDIIPGYNATFILQQTKS